jgi:toxin FitB
VRVVEWIDAQALETLFLSSITVAELRAGVALLPAGKRRAGLLERLETRVLPLFAGRVLPFDLGCTQAYAELTAKARAAGLTLPSADGFIAAIAAANGMAVASRDSGPFAAAGVTVINPWQA